jgi:hypothetical protein
MHVHLCLASVAQLELNALVQDAKDAVDGLKRQRESVLQALETTQQARGRPSQPPDETDMRVTRLLESLHRLTVALDQVMREIEQIESSSVLQDAEPFIVLPFSRTPTAINNHSILETNLQGASHQSL